MIMGKAIKILTCEGNLVECENHGQLKTIVPLQAIKKYEWCDILNRNISVPFRETFEYHIDFYVESKEAYENEDYITFVRWVSIGVE